MNTTAVCFVAAVAVAAAIDFEAPPTQCKSGVGCGPEQAVALADALFERLDADLDGKISHAEFKTADLMLAGRAGETPPVK